MSSNTEVLWLFKGLCNNTLPWQASQSHDIEQFLKHYSLHDSYWTGLFYHFADKNAATQAFQRALFWQKQRPHREARRVREWPDLFIQLQEIQEISAAHFTAYNCERAIASAEYIQLSDTHCLALDEVLGGQIQIQFSGSVCILAPARDGEPLQVTWN